MAAGSRIGAERWGYSRVGCDFALAHGTGEPGRAGADAAELPKGSSFFAVGRTMGVHHQTVQRCVERALAYGPMAALEDLPRPGKQPTITAEAKAWVVNPACRKAKELG